MARAKATGWDGAPNFRWVRMVNGRRLRVTCKELGLPPAKWTKNDSYQLANEWFERQAPTERIDPDKREAIASIERKIEWASTHDTGLVPGLKQVRQEIIRQTKDVARLCQGKDRATQAQDS